MPASVFLQPITGVRQKSSGANRDINGHGNAYDVAGTNRHLDEGYGSGIDTAKHVVSKRPAFLKVSAANATISTLASLESPWG